MAAPEHQHVIQAFVSNAAHPAFGDRVRLRRPHRRLDHAHTLGADELVERAGELGVPVVQQEARAMQALLDREVARLLAHPDDVGVGANTRVGCVNSVAPDLQGKSSPRTSRVKPGCAHPCSGAVTPPRADENSTPNVRTLRGQG